MKNLSHKNALKYVIYARKSTESDDKQAKSIPDQIHEMELLAHRLGLEVVGTYQEPKSGRKPSVSMQDGKVYRPQFVEMLKFISQGKADGILAWKANRLARNAKDAGDITQLLAEGLIREIRTSERIYVPTGNDRFFLFIDFGISTKQSDDIHDDVIRGLRTSFEAGLMPRQSPLGYLDQGKGVKILDETRAPLIKAMFELRATGNYSYDELVEEMQKRNLTSRSGKPIPKNSVFNMLHNPFYAGTIRVGFRSPDSAIHGTYEGKHPPIVSKELFEKVQNVTDGHDNGKKNLFFLFRGQVFCGLCGEKCYAQYSKKRYVYYCCRNSSCEQKSFPEQLIERQLEKTLKELNFSDSTMSGVRKLIYDKVHSLNAARKTEYFKKQKRLLEIKITLTNLLEEKVKGSVDPTTFQDFQKRLVGERDEIQSQITNHHIDDDRIAKEVEEFFKLAQSAYSSYKFAPLEKKPDLLKTLVSNLNVVSSNTQVVFNKPYDKIHETTRRAKDSSWCTRRDSNPLPSGPKPDALSRCWEELVELLVKEQVTRAAVH